MKITPLIIGSISVALPELTARIDFRIIRCLSTYSVHCFQATGLSGASLPTLFIVSRQLDYQVPLYLLCSLFPGKAHDCAQLGLSGASLPTLFIVSRQGT